MTAPTYRSPEEVMRAFRDLSAPKFFDMDGVLACYEWAAYTTVVSKGRKIYEDERLHYFRTCRPDKNALALAEALHLAGYPVYALTSVKGGIPWARFDKAWWLRRHAPWLDIDTRLIIASGDKAQAAMAQAEIAGLSRETVLFDDFNPNLWDWARAGGTPVKYLNGLNTPGTSGTGQYLPKSE